MLVTPSPSASRGEVILQSTYFTSSLYVNSLRNDITKLVALVRDEYARLPSTPPFTLFKSVWRSQGWHYLHFMVFDDQSRITFLDVTTRLLLERINEREPPFTAAVALFGLYTFLNTQPDNTAPVLSRLTHLQIPRDQYQHLKMLPSTMTGSDLEPLRLPIVFILSSFLQRNVFFILPQTDLGAMNPRDLPREVVYDDAILLPQTNAFPKKKGRPTKIEKSKRAKAALDTLEKWLETSACPPSDSQRDNTFTFSQSLDSRHILSTAAPLTALSDYQGDKAKLLTRIGTSYAHIEGSSNGTWALEKANKLVLERLQEAQSLVHPDEATRDSTTVVGLERVERAVREVNSSQVGRKGGALNLLEGAGLM